MFNRSNLVWAKQTLALDNNNNNNKLKRSELFYYHHHLTTLILVLLLVDSTLVTSSTLATATSSSSPLNSSSINLKSSIFGPPEEEDNSIFKRIVGPAISAFGGRRLFAVDDNGARGADTLQESQDDDHLDIDRLAESRGFSIESHQVTTRDGYILTLHRLVNPLLSGGSGSVGTPVILQHGILCASPFFLLASSPQLDRARRCQGQSNGTTTAHNETVISNSLAIELAQSGYDVWMPNFRGTQYSRKHVRPDWSGGRRRPEVGGGGGRAYWNFNVDSLVEHDLAAYVRYVLQLTGRQRYMFIGHSLGATVGLGSLLVHRDTEITRRMSCMILMAPVASTQFMRGRLMSLFRAATLIYQEPGPFPGATRTFSSFVGHICPRLRQLCVWLASMFVGTKRQSPDTISSSSSYDATQQLEFQNQVETFLMMMRQSVSVQMLQHIVQVHSSGRLSRFNYGPSANVRRYGQRLAPIYDLNKISQPALRLAIVSGQSDAISTPGEIGWISEQVRDKVGHFEQITVPVSPFNHMDLIMSSEAGNLVNKRMLEFIHQNECLKE